MIHPFSAFPVNDNLFIEWSPSHRIEMFAVGGAIAGSSDPVWQLTYQIPDPLPSGSPRFVILGQANSVSQTAILSMSWVAINKDGDKATAKAPEANQTINLPATANQPQLTTLTLGATTAPAAGQFLLVDAGFLGTNGSWTLNVNSLWLIGIEWT